MRFWGLVGSRCLWQRVDWKARNESLVLAFEGGELLSAGLVGDVRSIFVTMLDNGDVVLLAEGYDVIHAGEAYSYTEPNGLTEVVVIPADKLVTSNLESDL